jgi:hypothetical protein
MQVKDVKTLLDAGASYGRASGESQTHQHFVGDNVVLNETLLCGGLEDFIDLQLSESFDVNGTTLLVSLVIVMRVHSLNCFKLAEVEVLLLQQVRI